MIDLKRRRFLTIGVLSVAGLILPQGYAGASGAMIQAVEDPMSATLRLAKAVVEALPGQLGGRVQEHRAEVVELTRRFDLLSGYVVDHFDELPSLEETAAAIDGRRMEEFTLAEAQGYARRVMPIAVMSSLLRKYQLPSGVANAPRFADFAGRYKKVIWDSAAYSGAKRWGRDTAARGNSDV